MFHPCFYFYSIGYREQEGFFPESQLYIIKKNYLGGLKKSERHIISVLRQNLTFNTILGLGVPDLWLVGHDGRGRWLVSHDDRGRWLVSHDDRGRWLVGHDDRNHWLVGHDDLDRWSEGHDYLDRQLVGHDDRDRWLEGHV